MLFVKRSVLEYDQTCFTESMEMVMTMSIENMGQRIKESHCVEWDIWISFKLFFWLPQILLYRDRPFIRLVDQLLFDLDRNRASGLVFIDYKKAFDLTDHGLLLEQLKAYGVRDNELELLRSYLSGRTQYVHTVSYTHLTLPTIYSV